MILTRSTAAAIAGDIARDARNPQTPQEWQEAVNAASFLRAIADCEMYGLITTDLEIVVDRCDEILAIAAEELGIRPNKSVEQMLDEQIAQHRAKLQERASL